MFDDNIRVEPIPERVFELCKLVSRKSEKESYFRNLMEPESINTSSTVYFGIVRDVAIELGIIKKTGDSLEFVADKSVIKNLNSFRRYCNSLVWKRKDTYFYKIAKCFVESNDAWLQYSTLTDVNITKEVREKTGISNVQSVYMLGSRFWISFLGFGYIQEAANMNFLPNMYIALKDFILLSDFEKGKEYTVSEFLSKIMDISSVAIEDGIQNKTLNLAISNALRQLHDSKEITLAHHLDSKEVWHLFVNNSHQFVSDVTHLTYKGVKA